MWKCSKRSSSEFSCTLTPRSKSGWIGALHARKSYGLGPKPNNLRFLMPSTTRAMAVKSRTSATASFGLTTGYSGMYTLSRLRPTLYEKFSTPQSASPRSVLSTDLFSSLAARTIAGPANFCTNMVVGPSGPKFPRKMQQALTPSLRTHSSAASASFSFSIVTGQSTTPGTFAFFSSAMSAATRCFVSVAGKQSRLTPTIASFTLGWFIIFSLLE